MSLLPFWALNVVVAMLSIRADTISPHYQQRRKNFFVNKYFCCQVVV